MIKSGSLFEQVTKEAIANLIERHSTQARYGLFMSEEQVKELTQEFYDFLNQSMRIKQMGQDMMNGKPQTH